MSLASRMNSSVTLQRKTTTKVGGAPQGTYANVNSVQNEPCDIQPASSSVRYRFMQKQLVVDFTIFFTRDVGALASDRFVDAAGNQYQVQDGGYMPPAPGYGGKWPAQAHCVFIPVSSSAV